MVEVLIIIEGIALYIYKAGKTNHQLLLVTIKDHIEKSQSAANEQDTSLALNINMFKL